MRKQTRLQILAVLAAAFLGPVSPLRADITGTILGVVTDPSGAAVPSAAVTLRNAATGYVRRTVTDVDGSYQFLLVPVGSDYVLEAEKEGFQKTTQTGIKLLVNQKFRAELALKVGATTQTVEVKAAAAQVETASTQLGDVIEDRKMTGLPLNGRSYIDLLGLQAGVVPINSGVQGGDRPVSGNGNPGNLSVNGQREANNAFLVNGGDVEESRNNGASIVPVLDSIQEFRLVTNSFDAEYGRFSGAIVNVVTKSGTNQFHSSVFEFLRNEKLDSRNFFDAARGDFKRNQFGAAGGGPILKNRLFFFSDYQGTREVRGLSSGNITVPSALERTGDFSDVGTTGFNPLTGIVLGDNLPGHFAQVLSSRLGYSVTAGEPYWSPGCKTTAQCVFPGQVIPQAAWDPAAVASLKFIPTPVITRSGVPYFSTSAQKQSVRDDKLGERIDLNNERTGTWTFYYHFDDATLVNPYPAANVPGFAASTPSRSQNFSMSNAHTLSPTTVNEARANYTRLGLVSRQPVEGLGKITDFGFQEGGLGILPVYPSLEGMPYLNLGLLGVTIGVPDGTTGQYNNTFQVTDNFSHVQGRHTLKFGADLRYIQVNERNTYAQNGYFSFNGTETGNDFADYLIGAVPGGNFIQSSRQFLDSRTKYYGLYAQDSYKVNSNLTLNYGLRWEVSQPFYDTQGKIQAFVPGLQSKVYPDAPTGWVFPGDPGVPKTLAPTDYHNFGPRLGLAYSPAANDGALRKIFGGPGKTSIRAAFGLYYTAIEDLTLFNEVGDAPFGLFYVSPTAVYLNQPYKGRTSGADPGQRFPFSIPLAGATGIWPQYLPIIGAPVFKTDNVLPYAEHYNFSIQRELSASTILTVGYVGTQGHHLIAQTSFNPGDAQKCLQIRTQLGSTVGCGPGGEDTIYPLPNGQSAYGTRPYSVTSGRSLSQGLLDFGDSPWQETTANSNYNALQLSVEKRVGALRLLGAYTWAKSLDNASAWGDVINPFDARAGKALSTFDMLHNFVISYIYDLPFARLTSSGSGAVHKLLAGWEVSGITRFTTGLPVTINATGDYSLCGCSYGVYSGAERPNYDATAIHFVDPRKSANNAYFVETYDSVGNPVSPFFSTGGLDPINNPVYGVRGNANRRFFHGPGLNNWDISVQKNTPISERMSLQFRAEFFNVFNHAQFGAGPNGTPPRIGGTVGASNLGLVNAAADPRIGQFALKFIF
jgi:hypothetical protein